MDDPKPEKLKALREGNTEDFWLNVQPKCPHCGADFDIDEGEAWDLFDEYNGPHTLECPSCDQEFKVNSYASWTFSTDEQDDDNE